MLFTLGCKRDYLLSVIEFILKKTHGPTKLSEVNPDFANFITLSKMWTFNKPLTLAGLLRDPYIAMLLVY